MVSFSGLVSSLPLLGGAVAGILDPSRPDSKVARNVLEGKAEGYCSVSQQHASARSAAPATACARRRVSTTFAWCDGPPADR